MNKKIVSFNPFKRTILSIVLALMLPAVALPSVAQGASVKTNGDLTAAQALSNKITHGQVQVEKTVSGPEKNLTLIYAKAKNGAPVMAWMIDNKYLAMGPVVNDHGVNITQQYAKIGGLLPKSMPPASFAKDAGHSIGFTVGTNPQSKRFMVFLDPNCIYCNYLWKNAYPMAQSGKIILQVIPVGFLKPTSLAKAVTIMQSKSPVTAWAYNEKHFIMPPIEEGGIVPSKVLNQKIQENIQANTMLLAKSGTLATPTVIYCKKGAKVPTVLHGVSENGFGALLAGAENMSSTGVCK